jgi:hypothetical protein
MYCTTCGTPNPDHAVFCSRCGKRMATTPQATPIASPPSIPQATPPPTPPVATAIPVAQIPKQSSAPQDEDWIDAEPSAPRPTENVIQPSTPPPQELPMAHFPSAPLPIAQQQPAALPIISPPPAASWIDPAASSPPQPPLQSPPMARPEPVQPAYAEPVYAQPAQPQPMPYAPSPYAQPYPPQGAPATFPPRELRGIGGWLMFLVLCLTIFGPVISLFFVILLLVGAGSVGNTQPEIARFALVLSLLIIPYSVWGLMAGTGLWKMRPGAATRTKQYLLYGSIPFSIITNFLPLLMLPPSDQNAQALAGAVVGSVIGVGLALAWNAYLSKSRRVAATFPQG